MVHCGFPVSTGCWYLSASCLACQRMCLSNDASKLTLWWSALVLWRWRPAVASVLLGWWWWSLGVCQLMLSSIKSHHRECSCFTTHLIVTVLLWRRRRLSVVLWRVSVALLWRSDCCQRLSTKLCAWALTEGHSFAVVAAHNLAERRTAGVVADRSCCSCCCRGTAVRGTPLWMKFVMLFGARSVARVCRGEAEG